LQNEKLNVRMTGCPNGCARPYQSDIGIVGRSGDKFSVFVGGRILGDRLNFMLRGCDGGRVPDPTRNIVRTATEQRFRGMSFSLFISQI